MVTRRIVLGASAATMGSLWLAPAGRARAALLAPAGQLNAGGNPFAPYLAQGTVFTRSVASMPLAGNSAKIAAYMPTQPQQYCGQSGFGWLKTSLNTVSYTIPIYVVDSSNPNQTYATFDSTDPRVVNRPAIKQACSGRIPLPSYAEPAWGGDMPMSVWDVATGMARSYFHCERLSDGTWKYASATFRQYAPGFTDMATASYWMQGTQGSNSVVGMFNELSQIGIAEARAGVINHALSFTIANAKPGYSFPAVQGDGSSPDADAPQEGQWFRFPPDLDLDTLGLRPFTLLIAKAVQKYGGYAADRNLWCHAFNVEHPINETAAGKPDPWAAGGELARKYGGSLDPNDFPWDKTEWAPENWGSEASTPQPSVTPSPAPSTSTPSSSATPSTPGGPTPTASSTSATPTTPAPSPSSPSSTPTPTATRTGGGPRPNPKPTPKPKTPELDSLAGLLKWILGWLF